MNANWTVSFRGATRITFALLTAAFMCWCAAIDAAPSTQPSPESCKVPSEVLGNWVDGSISPTTFWDSQTGVFKGNARGMASYLTFNPDGTYKHYVYIEMRMYNMVTKVWTSMEGNVTFDAGAFTLKPVKGHYKTEGTRKIDRDMTDKELAEKVTTYKWRMEDQNGNQTLVVPFDDGSAYNYQRPEGEKK